MRSASSAAATAARTSPPPIYVPISAPFLEGVVAALTYGSDLALTQVSALPFDHHGEQRRREFRDLSGNLAPGWAGHGDSIAGPDQQPQFSERVGDTLCLGSRGAARTTRHNTPTTRAFICRLPSTSARACEKTTASGSRLPSARCRRFNRRGSRPDRSPVTGRAQSLVSQHFVDERHGFTGEQPRRSPRALALRPPRWPQLSHPQAPSARCDQDKSGGAFVCHRCGRHSDCADHKAQPSTFGDRAGTNQSESVNGPPNEIHGRVAGRHGELIAGN